MYALYGSPLGSVIIVILQYRGWDPEIAIQDYYRRIQDHEKHYQPVEETNWPSIRIINVRNHFNVAT